MKHLSLLLLLAFLLSTQASAQTKKDKWRLSHIVKEMKMDSELTKRFTPLFYSYMKELHAAKDIYDLPKDKYRQQIDTRKLTPQQGQELLDAHWNSDERVLLVRRKYTKQFSTILSPQQVYRVFSLANDKAQ